MFRMVGKILLLNITSDMINMEKDRYDQELKTWWRNEDWTEQQTFVEAKFVSNEPIVVIGGCARSGTTLCRVMLNAHPDIVIGPHTNIFVPITVNLPYIASQLSIDLDDVKRMHCHSSDWAEFIDNIRAAMVHKYNKPVWGEKTARNVHSFDWILRHFPNCRLIHMVRDGRDVISSLRTYPHKQLVDDEICSMPHHEMPLSECADRWLRATGEGMAFRGDERYIEVRYEDMVREPEATMRRILAVMGLPFNEVVLKHDCQAGPLVDTTKFYQNATAITPINHKAIGRWRKDISESEQHEIFPHLSQRLNELGYDASNGAL